MWEACCEWDGPKNAAGYGVDGLSLVHRQVYQVTFGWTKNFICHACDNPPCRELAHLFEGTHQDNVDDMVAKGCESIEERSFAFCSVWLGTLAAAPSSNAFHCHSIEARGRGASALQARPMRARG